MDIEVSAETGKTIGLLYNKHCEDLKAFHSSANSTISLLENSVQKSHGCRISGMQRRTDRETLEERWTGSKTKWEPGKPLKSTVKQQIEFDFRNIQKGLHTFGSLTMVESYK